MEKTAARKSKILLENMGRTKAKMELEPSHPQPSKRASSLLVDSENTRPSSPPASGEAPDTVRHYRSMLEVEDPPSFIKPLKSMSYDELYDQPKEDKACGEAACIPKRASRKAKQHDRTDLEKTDGRPSSASASALRNVINGVCWIFADFDLQHPTAKRARWLRRHRHRVS